MKSEYIPTIRELLDSAPEKHGDRPFVKYLREGEIQEKKFSQVREDALAVCRYLRKSYAGRQHVAIISKSTYEYIVAATAVLISGNVAIPLDPDSTAADAAAIINDSDATVLLYGEEFSDRLEETLALCPALCGSLVMNETEFQKIYREFSSVSEYAALSDVSVDPHACALIIYTSGTTGDKKGVMLSQYSLVSNVFFEPYDDIVFRPDAILSVLPLHHIFCFVAGYIGPLKIGNCICLNGEM